MAQPLPPDSPTDPNPCPVCSAPPAAWAKDANYHRLCVNGHPWYWNNLGGGGGAASWAATSDPGWHG